MIKKLRSKTWLSKGLTDGITPGQTEEWTDRMDENYIPLWHTSYAGGIIKNFVKVYVASAY